MVFKKRVLEYTKLILGTAITAFSTSLILLPNKLSTGGFSGIGTAMHYFLGIKIGTAVLILNIPVFIIAYIKLGKRMFFNSILGTFLLSFFLNIFEGFNLLIDDRFLACIFGGAISGIGTAITLKQNGSTGGSELLSRIIRTYKRDLSISNIIVILDIFIIIINVIAFKRIDIGLYSAIAIFISGKMLDIFFEGINFAKMMLIISPKYLEIFNKINKEIERGATNIKGLRNVQKRGKKYIAMCSCKTRSRENKRNNK